MKIGIVVPFSWSYWGGVVEHSENQAAALRKRGHEVKIVMGHDPPGALTRFLHPRSGRHGHLPPDIIPVGRSVVVPANGSLPNIVLSPRSIGRIRKVLRDERFDIVHLHEPFTPTICVATLVYADCPAVATWHAAGELAWMRFGLHVWGFLMERIETRIAVSRMAAASAERWLGPGFEIVPNGVVLPAHSDPERREHRIVFIGRHDARKGLPILLRAWPEIRRRTGATLGVCGADPLRVRLLMTRLGVHEGVDVLGFLPQERFTEELLAAKALVAPSLGGESFGIVLTRALACATPVVASDIPGYRAVMTPETSVAFPAGDDRALADAVVSLLDDEPRRLSLGAAGRRLVEEHYSWDAIGRRLLGIYESLAA
jgi:phosphatidyl-myo-inositol alpha-mannosyltransferase